MILAYCNAAGVIMFTHSKCPKGMLPIYRGRDAETRVSGMARLAYDNETLLVPGIPEAQTQEEALERLMDFCQRFRR